MLESFCRMKFVVLQFCQDHQILRSIVRLDAIDVVDMLIARELSTQQLLHDQSMFWDIPASLHMKHDVAAVYIAATLPTESIPSKFASRRVTRQICEVISFLISPRNPAVGDKRSDSPTSALTQTSRVFRFFGESSRRIHRLRLRRAREMTTDKTLSWAALFAASALAGRHACHCI